MKKLVSRSLIAAAVFCWTGHMIADAPAWRQAPQQPNYQTNQSANYQNNSGRSYQAAQPNSSNQGPYVEYRASPNADPNNRVDVQYRTAQDNHGQYNQGNSDQHYRSDMRNTPQPNHQNDSNYYRHHDYNEGYQDSDDQDSDEDDDTYAENANPYHDRTRSYEHSPYAVEDDNDDDDYPADFDGHGQQQSAADSVKQLVNTLRTLKLKGDSLSLNYETVDGKTFELDLPNVDADLKFEHNNGNHIVRGTLDAEVKTELYSKKTDTVENNTNIHLEGSLSFSSWESLERLSNNFFAPGDAHLALDLTKFKWSSDYVAYDGKGLFSFERKQDQSVFNYVEDSKASLTSKYDDFLRTLVKNQILESDRQDLKEHLDDWLDLVPKPSKWGDIKNDHDAELTCKFAPNGDALLFGVNVKKSRLTVGSYGLDWNMNLQSSHNFQDTNLNSHVVLMSYKSLIDELGNYANRWINTSNKYAKDEHEKMPLVDDQDKNEIVALFKKLSANPNSDSKDWVTDIRYNNEGLRIGTLTGEQASAEWNKVWDRISKKFQPAEPAHEQVAPAAPALQK